MLPSADHAKQTNSNSSRAVVISIVSHGHGEQVARLLNQLARLPAGTLTGLVLTLNAPALDQHPMLATALADTGLVARLNLQILRNTQPLGFGVNHNKAFKFAGRQLGLAGDDIFCIANPDIELLGEPAANKSFDTDLFASLASALTQPGTGLAYPTQLDAAGQVLDFERALATPKAVFLRRFGMEPGGVAGARDWVSGAFMAFRADVFAELGGFDERYFMYGEDVDICLRLQLAGYALSRAGASVIHHTQRQTLRNLRHLSWHIQSLLRLWRSKPYRQYRDYLARQRQR